MLNVYRGDIRERIAGFNPAYNVMSVTNTILYKKDAILIEINENKFIDVDDLLSENKKILNLYSFYKGEYYVDVKSLVNIREENLEKTYVRTK